MKKTNLHILILITTMLMLSCSTPRRAATLDILRPSVATFDKSINNLLLVNNSTIQPYDKGHYTMHRSGKVVNETIVFDSTAIFCLTSVKEQLAVTGFFNSVKLIPKSINIKGDFYHPTPLTAQQVKTLCQTYNADGILSLNHTMLRDEKNDLDEYLTTDMYLYTNWSIHTLTDPKKIQQLEFADSLSWGVIEKRVAPKMTDMMVDMAMVGGEKIAYQLLPQWEQEERFFFAPKDKTMQQAMHAVKYQEWQKAIALWQKATTHTADQTRLYQAYSNIAIAYEITGDIERAIQYTQRTLKAYTQQKRATQSTIDELKAYLTFLNQRKIDTKLLDKQLSN